MHKCPVLKHKMWRCVTFLKFHFLLVWLVCFIIVASTSTGTNVTTVNEPPDRADSSRQLALGTKTIVVFRVRVRTKDAWHLPTRKLREVADDIFGTVTDKINVKKTLRKCSGGQVQIRSQRRTPLKSGVANIAARFPRKSLGELTQKEIVERVIDRLENKELPLPYLKDAYLFSDLVIFVLPPNVPDYYNEGNPGVDWNSYVPLPIPNKIIVVNDRQVKNDQIMLHEAAHALYGLGHSGHENHNPTTEGGSKEYGDWTGLMGNSFRSGGDDGTPQCFNAAKSWQLGWYQARQISLDPLVQPCVDLIGMQSHLANKGQTGEYVVAEIKQEPDQGDLYLMFNEKKGLTRATREPGCDNSVTVVQQKGMAPNTPSNLLGCVTRSNSVTTPDGKTKVTMRSMSTNGLGVATAKVCISCTVSTRRKLQGEVCLPPDPCEDSNEVECPDGYCAPMEEGCCIDGVECTSSAPTHAPTKAPSRNDGSDLYVIGYGHELYKSSSTRYGLFRCNANMTEVAYVGSLDAVGPALAGLDFRRLCYSERDDMLYGVSAAPILSNLTLVPISPYTGEVFPEINVTLPLEFPSSRSGVAFQRGDCSVYLYGIKGRNGMDSRFYRVDIPSGATQIIDTPVPYAGYINKALQLTMAFISDDIFVAYFHYYLISNRFFLYINARTGAIDGSGYGNPPFAEELCSNECRSGELHRSSWKPRTKELYMAGKDDSFRMDILDTDTLEKTRHFLHPFKKIKCMAWS